MLKLRKVAVTGGVACGKSTVCHLLHQLSAYVVSADAIVHELLDDSQERERIIELFGPDIVQDGKINKSTLASKVFQEVFQAPERLRALEAILHPAVLKRIGQRYIEACKGNYRAFVVEIPLLFEIEAEGDYDAVIAVLADEEIAKKRFIKKGYSDVEYKARMSRQMPSSIKAEKANYIINNNGTLEDLEKQVKSIIEEILIHES